MPLVSLCLPTLDRGPLLGRTLRSLAAQTFRDLEILVVDNASATDAAAVLVAELGDERVRYLRQPERVGMGTNWNRALAEARGTYVAVFHDDDVYDPGVVEAQVRRLEGDPALAFIHGPTRHVDESGKPLWICDHGWPARVPGVEFRRRMALHPKRSLVEAQTVMARASAYRAAGPFLEDWILATDAEMWLRLSRQGDVACLPEPMVEVRIRMATSSDVTPRTIVQLWEKAEVADRMREELSGAERLLARARWDAVLARDLLVVATKGTPEVRAEARRRLVPRLDPVLRPAVDLALADGIGSPMRSALRSAAGLRRKLRRS